MDRRRSGRRLQRPQPRSLHRLHLQAPPPTPATESMRPSSRADASSTTLRVACLWWKSFPRAGGPWPPYSRKLPKEIFYIYPKFLNIT
jgi:hypothetical protein